MAEGLAILCGVLLVMTATTILRKSGDAFAPPVVFAPMLFYCYAFVPAVVLFNDAAETLLTSEATTKTCLLNFLGVSAFLVGALPRRLRRTDDRGIHNLELRLTNQMRSRLIAVALGMGTVAVAVYCYNISYSGGWVKVFSRPKPYVSSPSGYIGELPVIAFPAALLYALGQSGGKLTLNRVLSLLFILSPHLVTATLGGRRGPAFYCFGTLSICSYLITARRPSWSTLIAGMGAIGLTMLFLVSNRRNLGVGQENDVDVEAFWDAVVPSEVDSGHEFVVSAGLVNSADYYQDYGWGLRYFALLFVRPIPRQLWPTKYEDLGLSWMVDSPGIGRFEEFEWEEAVGFVPPRGTAGGFITDMYVEFSWLAVIPLFLIGMIYARSYRASRRRGGVWTLVYIELLVLSVHLPAQSVQSWMYRAMMLVGVTLIAWRLLLGRKAFRTSDNSLNKSDDATSDSGSVETGTAPGPGDAVPGRRPDGFNRPEPSRLADTGRENPRTTIGKPIPMLSPEEAP